MGRFVEDVVAIFNATKESKITRTRATDPASVGVPSLINLGNAVSLIPLSCISFNNELYVEFAFLSLGSFLTASLSKEAALRYSTLEDS